MGEWEKVEVESDRGPQKGSVQQDFLAVLRRSQLLVSDGRWGTLGDKPRRRLDPGCFL